MNPKLPYTFRKTLSAISALALLLLAAGCGTVKSSSSVVISADNPCIAYSGRSEGLGTSQVTVGYSGARERLRFDGTSVSAKITDDGENYAMVWVDGKAGQKIRLNAPDGTYVLAEGLEPGEHTVEVVRVTECAQGLVHFHGFVLNKGAKALDWKSANDRKIEFIGDSITCGYGVEVNDRDLHFDPATENFCLGYSGLTARALNADYLVVSRSGIGMVRNYDGPYEGSDNTMPDNYPNTFYMQPGHAWNFSLYTPDVVCINLGTNDFSTTGVDADKYVSTYVDFAKGILTRYPAAKLVLLQGPMNNNDDLKAALARVLDALSAEAPGRVSSFELSAQGALGYGADWHPNREQSKVNAAELTEYLSSLMGWE